MTHVRDRKTGRAGAPLMDVDIKLVNWDEGNYRVTDQPNPRGEIHVGGDNVAVGYFKNEKETAANFYEENGRRWFRTGDIGEFEQDGVLKIIDRKKDLVKLQHGEYVSYGKTESVLKTAPIVENICAYANPDRDFIIAILIPDKNQLKALNTELSLNEACKDVEVKKQVCALLKDYGNYLIIIINYLICGSSRHQERSEELRDPQQGVDRVGRVDPGQRARHGRLQDQEEVYLR